MEYCSSRSKYCSSTSVTSLDSVPCRHGFTVTEKRFALNGGFTVIELLITLVVAAILLTAAVPNLRTFVQNAQTTSTADTFLTVIQQARSEAITRGDAVLLCRTADPSSNTCGTSAVEDWTDGWLMYVVRNFAGQVNYDATNTTHELIRRGTPAPEGIAITSDSDGNQWLAFAADGSLNENGTVAYAICDDRGAQTGRLIVVPMLGRPYMTKDMTAAPNCEPT